MRIKSVLNGAQSFAVRRDVPAQISVFAPASLSEAEAARYLGMSRAWLKKSRTRRFCQTSDAPPYVRAGARRIVYRREDLDSWQRQHLESVGAGKR
jgi:predicted DNA-binding transcriptional regulator AlpA